MTGSGDSSGWSQRLCLAMYMQPSDREGRVRKPFIPAEPRLSEHESKRLSAAFADDHPPVIGLALDVQHLMPISRGAIGHVSSPLIIKQHLKDLACL